MATRDKTLSITRVKIADLKPHPRQQHLFAQPATAEIVALAEDMHARGLQHPIEVLLDLTILCGHSRVLAAHHLGWQEIDAFVRNDFDALNDVEIEKHMIGDNALRRQLRPLERARCAHRLRELFHGGNCAKLDYDSWDDVHIHTRDWVGAIMHISGRTASRMLAILETPADVQQAYDEGGISMGLASKIANLPQCDQEEIAGEIRRGVDPKTAAHKFFPRRRKPTADEGVYKRLIVALGDAMVAFEDGFADVRAVDVDEEDPVVILRASVSLLESLACHVERRLEEQEEALADKMDSISQLGGTLANAK